MSTLPKKIKAKKFDKLFDEGKDVSAYLNLKNIKIDHPIHRITINISGEVLHQIDKEAIRIGVRRTVLIKTWITERVDALFRSHSSMNKKSLEHRL